MPHVSSIFPKFVSAVEIVMSPSNNTRNAFILLTTTSGGLFQVMRRIKQARFPIPSEYPRCG